MKTAVEWLIDMLVIENEITLKGENYKLFDQAKQMEKEQMNELFKAGVNYGSGSVMATELGEDTTEPNFEQYYNETFKSE